MSEVNSGDRGRCTGSVGSDLRCAGQTLHRRSEVKIIWFPARWHHRNRRDPGRGFQRHPGEGFNVRADASARKVIELSLDLQAIPVIYDPIDEVKQAMSGKLAPEASSGDQWSIEARKVPVAEVRRCCWLHGHRRWSSVPTAFAFCVTTWLSLRRRAGTLRRFKIHVNGRSSQRATSVVSRSRTTTTREGPDEVRDRWNPTDSVPRELDKIAAAPFIAG